MLNAGTHIIYLKKTWEKLLLAARAVAAIENPADVCVVSARPYAQRALLKFAAHTGATPIFGRFTPGCLTNQIQKSFKVDSFSSKDIFSIANRPQVFFESMLLSIYNCNCYNAEISRLELLCSFVFPAFAVLFSPRIFSICVLFWFPFCLICCFYHKCFFLFLNIFPASWDLWNKGVSLWLFFQIQFQFRSRNSRFAF